MKDLSSALEKLSDSFEVFAQDLRSMADNLAHDQGKVNIAGLNKPKAGWGEEPDADHHQDDDFQVDDDDDDNGNVVALGNPKDHDGVHDETVITMKSGDLRKVINSYRKLSRAHREGRIIDQDERVRLHEAVRAVKHLIRRPRVHH